MKVKFRQTRRHPRFYLLCLLYAFCIADILMGSGLMLIGINILLFVALPITPKYVLPYTVDDDGTVKGNGTVVYIQNIQKIVYQKDRVDIYALDPKTGKVRFKCYFPKDKEAFVEKLVGENPNIQVI